MTICIILNRKGGDTISGPIQQSETSVELELPTIGPNILMVANMKRTMLIDTPKKSSQFFIHDMGMTCSSLQ